MDIGSYVNQLGVEVAQLQVDMRTARLSAQGQHDAVMSFLQDQGNQVAQLRAEVDKLRAQLHGRIPLEPQPRYRDEL
ncbi:MAG: hypothetical protein JOY61_24420 [Chloroflexi bacterium]|nr:hypothetical protein [Chloroflexota bacterium]